jgi:hypothetical protein
MMYSHFFDQGSKFLHQVSGKGIAIAPCLAVLSQIPIEQVGVGHGRTFTVTVNVPVDDAIAVPRDGGAPPFSNQLIQIVPLGVNFEPVIVTVVYAGPEAGETEMG